MSNPSRAKRAFNMLAVGILAAAALGIAAGFGAAAYAHEPACLGTVGETVETEVGLLNMLLADPAAVVADEINFVLDTVHDPFGAVNDEIDTVHDDLDSVQACLE